MTGKNSYNYFMRGDFYVYILTNIGHTVLYTGVTSNLPARLDQHREKTVGSFTSRYNVTILVYYELCDDAQSAIEREKQIKGGSRKKKLDLITSINPEWKDLAEDID
ncbi:MAG: GIY-YIG nuclease family protein [Anaerolineaceae bacterium]